MKRAWFILLLGIVLMFVFPIGLGILRLFIVAGLIVLWLGGLHIFRRSILFKVLFIVSLLLVLLVLFVPGKAADPELLRSTYVESLQSYEGVRYLIGGENRMGIDCSGLVREGYIDANIKVGLRTLNPRLLRKAVFIWWYDCAADALGYGYKGMTELVTKADSMDKLDFTMIEPGDIIVPEGGFHTFVYIGGDTWLEADPEKGEVVKISTAERARDWRDLPVSIMRWSEFV